MSELASSEAVPVKPTEEPRGAIELPPDIARLTRDSMQGRSVTTMAVGGPLPLFATPNSIAEVQSLLHYLRQTGGTHRTLGAGSNLIISDCGVSDWVIRLGRGFRQIDGDGGLFTVGAGVSFMSLSRSLSDEGWSGLEFAGGIPASIGGAVVMNAGAHGSELSSVIETVSVIDSDGKLSVLKPEELKFSYRHCELPPRSIVVGAQLRLVQGDKERSTLLRAHYLNERKARQPLSMPSSGSIFRNPSPERSAGSLIEQAGLKGVSSGGAFISPVHANWIVNPERRAHSADIQALIERCRSAVFERFGITLQTEAVTW